MKEDYDLSKKDKEKLKKLMEENRKMKEKAYDNAKKTGEGKKASY